MNKHLILAAVATVGFAGLAVAASNKVDVSETGSKTCIASNGIPDHTTGNFPNRGNPNRIKSQNIKFCVTSSPTKGDRANYRVRTVGIATNGILIRPGTADWYDASSPRGHSRDRSSGWNLEGIGSKKLGTDNQNAHVDHRGIYHYHGMPAALINTGEGTLMGYAADGFEIHYAGTSAQASYTLKAGKRATAPFGKHDGTYNQDWEYNAGAGNLDQCNGATVNGTYTYFATDSYPFFPRCLYGTQITQYH